MAFNDIIKKIFGNKAQRDLREIEPFVSKTKKAYETVVQLSNDELRAFADDLKQKVRDYTAADTSRMEELKASVEETEIHLREKIYHEIDKLEKEVISKNEKILE